MHLARRLTPRRIVRSVTFRVGRIVSPPAQRAANPYCTHVPVLVGLARELPVRRVLELGSGRHSTLTFLDRSAFPDLQLLDSVETEPAWREEILAAANGDPRLNLSLVPVVAEHVPSIDFTAYDLVFVDDSSDEVSRGQTIRAVSQCRAPRNVVVVHDFEVPTYRAASAEIPFQFEFNAFNPLTGVCWEEAPLDRRGLGRMLRFMRRNAKTPPDKLIRWVQLFEQRSRQAR